MNLSYKKYWDTVDDLCSHINVGTGIDISIKDLAYLIKKVVQYEGEITFNSNQPDGTQRKLMSISKLKSLGWSYDWELEAGIENAYEWFLKNIDNVRTG
jgi:GDP-L-fucose synthase